MQSCDPAWSRQIPGSNGSRHQAGRTTRTVVRRRTMGNLPIGYRFGRLGASVFSSSGSGPKSVDSGSRFLSACPWPIPSAYSMFRLPGSKTCWSMCVRYGSWQAQACRCASTYPPDSPTPPLPTAIRHSRPGSGEARCRGPSQSTPWPVPLSVLSRWPLGQCPRRVHA